jgi:hypothetical protein
MSNFRAIALGELFFESSRDNVVATGSTQATAAPIGPVEMTRVTSVSAGTGVILPPAQAGLCLLIVNHSSAQLQVYPQPGDAVDDVTGAAGVPQMQNSWVFYGCFTPGNWYTEGLASGFQTGGGSFATFSTQVGITSTAGGTQGTSVLLTAMNCQITAPASGATGVLLPPAKPGMEITLMNNSTSATPPTVFASGSDTINGTAGATGVAGPANAAAPTIYYVFAAGAWVTK